VQRFGRGERKREDNERTYIQGSKLGSSAAVLVARFDAGSRTRGRCHTLQQP
jgi:hypothetical protein